MAPRRRCRRSINSSRRSTTTASRTSPCLQRQRQAAHREPVRPTDLTVGGVSAPRRDRRSTGGRHRRRSAATTSATTCVKQFNELRDQLDKLADDASFNGINLLRGDKLKLTFNETGTSTIDIQAKDADWRRRPRSTTRRSASPRRWPPTSTRDARHRRPPRHALTTALGQLRSQASAFGSNLSIVQNRQDFTKNDDQHPARPAPTNLDAGRHQRGSARTSSPCRPASSCPRRRCRWPRSRPGGAAPVLIFDQNVEHDGRAQAPPFSFRSAHWTSPFC